MDWKKGFSYTFLIFVGVLCTTIPTVTAQGDIRCKCVCPDRSENTTTNKQNVYHNVDANPEECTCEYVVKPTIKEIDAGFCFRCDCKYQRRNTTTIKVIVNLIIVIVLMLGIYMLFLLILDPVMTIVRKRTQYEQYQDDQDEITTPRQSRDRIGSKTIVTRVRDTQERWKGTVQEQRKNIFDKHTMLN
ncbi:transmembrane protein 9 isoform X2 [Lingula anatina]|uniref:Transmembrane protein 9 isoform X2 n=1 Tax=Lingula anatina TaxID=7574 RepID=A0A1S3IQA8_LINAN|nr:transmembrane protein 9 isoform X2 [Lingula anatina]|eukprot:XP_013400402.1 transmembrane protein 9 isoform X2 [Lingula anatina]